MPPGKGDRAKEPADNERGFWTPEELLAQLVERCGVGRESLLIVHSSMKSLGLIEGGPEDVVWAIQTAVGVGGTVLMPVFTAPEPSGIFRLDATPSRTGLITETLRTAPGVLRSHHPTHSVAAWGARDAEFVAGHDRTSGLGVDSPFHKAAQAGADVLMIGCDLRTCSLIHVAEAVVRVPYLGRVCYPGYDRTLTLVDEGGARTPVEPHDVPTDSAGFTVVQDELDRRGYLTRCRLASAECLKFHAAVGLGVAAELLRADAAALLCDNPRCAVCPQARAIVEEHRES